MIDAICAAGLAMSPHLAEARRLSGVAGLLLGLAASPAVANPPEATIQVKALEGCSVEVAVRRLRSATGPATIYRARGAFAFLEPACRQEVKSLEGAPPTSSGATYDTFVFADQVCGDGRWAYRLATATMPLKEGAYSFPVHDIEVHGCHPAAPCPKDLDAPLSLTVAPELALSCENRLGRLTFGAEKSVREHLGPVLTGQDVVALEQTDGGTRLRALLPGLARISVAPDGGSSPCAEIEVRPTAEQWASLELRRRWEYRELGPGLPKADEVVSVSPESLWVLPTGGVLSFGTVFEHPLPTVDPRCRPALQIHRGGDGSSAGLRVTQGDGTAHYYLLDWSGHEPTAASAPGGLRDAGDIAAH